MSTSSEKAAVQVSEKGQLTVKGGTIQGSTAVLLNGAEAKAEFRSGTVKGDKYSVEVNQNCEATISGGTFEGTVYVHGKVGNKDVNGKLKLSGSPSIKSKITLYNSDTCTTPA